MPGSPYHPSTGGAVGRRSALPTVVRGSVQRRPRSAAGDCADRAVGRAVPERLAGYRIAWDGFQVRPAPVRDCDRLASAVSVKTGCRCGGRGQGRQGSGIRSRVVAEQDDSVSDELEIAPQRRFSAPGRRADESRKDYRCKDCQNDRDDEQFDEGEASS